MEIRPFSTADISAWAALLAVSFDRQSAEMHNLLHYLQALDPLIAYGAWDGTRLAAQYSCLLRQLHLPNQTQPVQVGLSLNMAVHPDYRGRGLIKQVAAPVYAAVREAGGIAGVGFSNAEGVKVDKRSKGYGYRVVGKMQPMLTCLLRQPRFEPLILSDTFPETMPTVTNRSTGICFNDTSRWLRQRFDRHPFRQYQYAFGEDGVVVFRPNPHTVSLLAAHGTNIPTLINRWLATLWQSGIRYIHTLTSPASTIKAALQQTALTISLPYTRTPYYLTAKPLRDETPDGLFDFGRWDCIGGVIL